MAKEVAQKTDPPLHDWREEDTLVLVLGDTGSGRSTFINYALGSNDAPVARGPDLKTKSIYHFVMNRSTHPKGRFILVDTPGFDAGLWEDYQVLERLAKWLKQSLPSKGPKRVAIIYLLEIDQLVPQESKSRMSPGKLLQQGITKNVAICTTKWRNDQPKDAERLQEVALSESYGYKIHSFRDTTESAWRIIDSVPDSIVNVVELRRRLGSTLPVPTFKWATSFMRRLTSWIGGGDFGTPEQHSPPGVPPPPKIVCPSIADTDGAGINGDTLPKPDYKLRLEEISRRLITAFSNTHEYKRLLSSQGSEAQALLDTFQSILRMEIVDEHNRRNFIVAAKRLSSKTDLYPRQLLLEDVQQVDDQSVDSGGFADIYKGTFQGKHVCLKIIRVHQNETYSRIIKAIAREAILWGQLSHPNLLPFYGLHRPGRQLWLVSPWAENGNVVQFLKANPTASRVHLCSDIAGGVAYLHRNEVIHGDLKGANVLVDRSCRAYLGDFGLSGVEDLDILQWSSQSRLESKGGTVRWQAPELFDPNDDNPLPCNTQASDVYAWACVCYEIFTDKLPFFEHREVTVIMKTMAGVRPTRPTALIEDLVARGLTDNIWALMNECWDHDPAKRPNMKKVLWRLAAAGAAVDHRMPGELTGGPAMRDKSLNDSDVPLTLEDVNAIISRTTSSTL